jgi:hypothetical protein
LGPIPNPHFINVNSHFNQYIIIKIKLIND